MSLRLKVLGRATSRVYGRQQQPDQDADEGDWITTNNSTKVNSVDCSPCLLAIQIAGDWIEPNRLQTNVLGASVFVM
jgi:hypothetical protein